MPNSKFCFIYNFAVASKAGSNMWGFISLTYDNGDKSDNWCGSHTKVPVEMTPSTFYATPKCGIRNLFAYGKNLIENIVFTKSIDYFICT